MILVHIPHGHIYIYMDRKSIACRWNIDIPVDLAYIYTGTEHTKSYRFRMPAIYRRSVHPRIYPSNMIRILDIYTRDISIYEH